MTETRPSFTCPRCECTTTLPSDVAARYCPRCRWWTGDSLLASDDVMAQAQIDGPEHLWRFDEPADRLDFTNHLLVHDEEIRRILMRHLAAQERIRALFQGFTSSMACTQAAFERLGAVMRSQSAKLAEMFVVRPVTSRVVTKRLRRGRVRDRYVTIWQAQPQPWKVAR